MSTVLSAALGWVGLGWGHCAEIKFVDWVFRREENRSSRRKTSWSIVQNKQTQPTCDAKSENPTMATLVGCECSQYFAIPPPKRYLWSWMSSFKERENYLIRFGIETPNFAFYRLPSIQGRGLISHPGQRSFSVCPFVGLFA